jgi:hypothetical protein
MARIKFFDGAATVLGNHNTTKELTIALLGPTSGTDRGFVETIPMTKWRAEFIHFISSEVVHETLAQGLVERLVFVVPEFMGELDGADDRTFGSTAVPEGIEMSATDYGLEMWKEEHFTSANIIALYLGYNITDTPGYSGRIETGDVLRAFPKKTLAVIPKEAKRGKAQYLIAQTRGARFVGSTIHDLAMATIREINQL